MLCLCSWNEINSTLDDTYRILSSYPGALCLKVPSKHERHEATWSHELVTLASRFRGMISRKGLIATARRYEEVFVGGESDIFSRFMLAAVHFFHSENVGLRPSPVRWYDRRRRWGWKFGQVLSLAVRFLEIQLGIGHFSKFPSLDSQFQGFPSGVEIFSGM